MAGSGLAGAEGVSPSVGWDSCALPFLLCTLHVLREASSYEGDLVLLTCGGF